MSQKIVIIGGVAGGASAAARARRLNEDASITVIEKGPFVSFANCGLPYALGGVIEEQSALLLQTPESLKARFNLDVLVNTEAIAIDRENKQVLIKNSDTTHENIPYDKLIIATGAEAIRPPLPGFDLPGVFTLQTIPDLNAMQAWIKDKDVKSAVIVGGGFIGVEVAENLVRLGLRVSLIERGEQVFAPVDPEIAELLHDEIRAHGVDLRLGASVSSIRKGEGAGLEVDLGSGDGLPAGLVLLAVGVKPRSGLAREAKLDIGPFGGIVVDEGMRTSDPDIFAVGDVIEVRNPITSDGAYVPLAGPANRQGRIAADRIFGRESSYRGTLGTSICQVFGLNAGSTGINEKTLMRAGRDYDSVTLHPADHATYYPGATRMTIKLVFEKTSGKILGFQAVGKDGVDKRIDVLAMALQAGMTVFDLEHAELSYAPPFGSAKDPVNYAAFLASNALRGDLKLTHAKDLVQAQAKGVVLLDVRTKREFEAGHIPGAIHIPVDELRSRVGEIPKSAKLVVYCQVGLRGYVAQRVLVQKGFDVSNLNGGIKSWSSAVGLAQRSHSRF